MNKREIEVKTEQLVTPIVEEQHFELVDVEYVKEGSNWYLRVYVDKENGIDIDDCVMVSRALEAKLDEEDFIADAYILEVSSPGLTRPLKKEKDFIRNMGRRVEVKLFKVQDGLKEFEAELTGFEDGVVTLKPDGIEGTFCVSLKEIAMIRLAFE
ncbi:MAG: ribosome maturation factor RimP [Lachnospira sp.]|nr:ribosome maturation factor RimP [Lachnospira sp.]